MIKTRLILAAVASLLLAGCEKPLTPEDKIRSIDYVGTVSVEYEGSVTENRNITVRYLPSEDGKSAEIKINRIKFVPQMPLTIDVTIPSVSLDSYGEGNRLEADGIVPIALGGRYEKFKVSALTGTQDSRTLSFSLKFGEHPTSFYGERVR